MPLSVVLARELYTFSIGYYSKSKECLKVVKVLPDPLPQFTSFKKTRLARRFLLRETYPRARYTVILTKEKQCRKKNVFPFNLLGSL